MLPCITHIKRFIPLNYRHLLQALAGYTSLYPAKTDIITHILA
jgi:hypothetical protein